MFKRFKILQHWQSPSPIELADQPRPHGHPCTQIPNKQRQRQRQKQRQRQRQRQKQRQRHRQRQHGFKTFPKLHRCLMLYMFEILGGLCDPGGCLQQWKHLKHLTHSKHLKDYKLGRGLSLVFAIDLAPWGSPAPYQPAQQHSQRIHPSTQAIEWYFKHLKYLTHLIHLKHLKYY